MKYIALLRGINVGGNNKVPMKELRECFVSLGFENVSTYINSGNVLFETDKASQSLSNLCERAFEEHFGFFVWIMTISSPELSEALANAPDWWDSDTDSKHNALFVIPPATAQDILSEIGASKPEYERADAYGKVIFWSAPVKTYSRTRLSKIVGTKAYGEVTMRNANTAKNSGSYKTEGKMDNKSTQFVKNLKLGWNLGNTLDAIGGEGTASETAWGNPVTTKDMITAIRDAGFNILRVPTTWYSHILPDGTVDPAWMDRVAQIVGWGLECGMYVILNLHHENWHAPTYASADKAERILTSLWTQISERFRDTGEHLIFEGMNEPRLHGSPNEWSGGDEEGREVINKLNSAFVRTVRAAGGYNSSRHLMVPVYAASSYPKAWEGFTLPEDGNISVSIHSYSPYDYALNTKGVSEWSIDNTQDTKSLDNLFDSIARRFTDSGVPVIMGEFGAMNKNNAKSRAVWAEYYTRKAREKGIPCVWWDNGSFEGEGELFGLLDRKGLSYPYPEIVEALKKGAGI